MRGTRHAVLLYALLAIGAGPSFAAGGTAASSPARELAAEETRSGADSPALLPLLDRLAAAQFDDGDFAAAAAARQRALRIATMHYGPTSPYAAAALVALARLDIERHRYLDAEPLLTEAASIAEPGNPLAAAILVGRARIALARGEAETAADLAARAAEGDGGSEALRTLGAIYASRGRFADGETVLRQALARDQARADEDNGDLARSSAQLANLLLRQKRFLEALPPIETAIAIDETRLGANHPLIADDYADLGLIYDGLGRARDARAALGHAVALLRAGAGKDTPRLAYAQLEWAKLLRAGGDVAAADAATAEAERILKKARSEERWRERQL